ncbi:adenylyl cyclase X E isoform X1 [Drosophila santomea]|uniref:adenylyl cyclase X E isoform X1 n=2 Tax=Drosophila santomea TaxID=129105 RepID=UPI0019540AEE|nr:adenylyl cyclase X E isoform X1 [Drosophila santomea]
MNKKNTCKTPYRERFRRCYLEYTNECLWELSYLKAKCKELNLEEEYMKYKIRLMISYLTVFYPLVILVIVGLQVIKWAFTEYKIYIYLNLIFDGGSLILVTGLLSINFFEKFVNRHRWVMTVTSILSAYVIVMGDIAHTAYHYYHSDWPLNTSYDVFVLCMIYMFLPISSILAAALLAISVSVIYVLYYIHFIVFSDHNIAKYVYGLDIVSIEFFHYLGFNMMGIFFRIMNATVVRSSFLDRYQFIKEEIWLRQARRQESLLLDSILPPQIAKPIQKSIKDKIMRPDNDYYHLGSSRTKENFMSIQIHNDVSILYADVVNYTYLTTTLTVEKLVKVLHDLYARFDLAASSFRVQRIKFLGDCYYCVAGLGESDPDHASMAVALGISMIANIKEVRVKRSLDIDMRIGVHSGTLFAGVIGEAKLQYDIWGADVNIASLLESTGKPGYVHVSGRTLSSLNAAEYKIFPGTEAAQRDPELQKHPMSTYLLAALPYRNSGLGDGSVRFDRNLDLKTVGTNRKSQVSQLISLSEELREEFSKMPVGGFKFRFPWSRRERDLKHEKVERDLGIFCVAFKDKSLEWDYLHQPDYIFKYSVLLGWGIGCCLIYIQYVNNAYLWYTACIIDMIAFLVLTSLLFICWFKKVCWWRSRQDQHKSYSKLSCAIFHMFEKIQHSFVLRVTVYMMMVLCYYMVMSLTLINCDQDQYELDIIQSKLFHYEMDPFSCFHPWACTNMVALILGMSYTFARIPFALKTFIGCSEAVFFLLIVYFQFHFIFEHSSTTCPFLKPEIAHFSRVCMMLMTMYAKERQSEFNTKMNYKLNLDLQKKQKSADVTNQSIIILLNNILPSHVVEVYLNSLAKHELYHENYRMVSVMFAKLTNFQMDLPSLRVLHDIITEFDRLLYAYKEYYVVEKIKVVGCTYMAACGLDFSLIENPDRTSKFGSASMSSEMEQVRSRQESTVRDNDHDEVAFIMTTFALDLMRVLSVCNNAYADKHFVRSLSTSEIRIGISTGQIMAGVVGASQPHYDIWGNAVNMASRMESTGLSGHIQVTKETAQTLEEFDIQCTYRGLTFVKGRGEIPTYFVGIDNDLKFISSKTISLLERPVTIHLSHDLHGTKER